MAVSPAASGGPRVPLYAQPSRSSRILLIVVGVLTCLWVLGAWTASSAAVYFGGWFAGIILIAAIGFPMAVRSGAWLEGSTLVVRSSLSTRRYDLAACSAHLAEDPKTRLPVLTVQDAAGRRDDVLLREPRSRNKEMLAPQKLNALAGAVLAAGRRDPAGEQVAGQLRWLADNWPGTRSPSLR
jgi:hypothetical protein